MYGEVLLLFLFLSIKHNVQSIAVPEPELDSLQGLPSAISSKLLTISSVFIFLSATLQCGDSASVDVVSISKKGEKNLYFV